MLALSIAVWIWISIGALTYVYRDCYYYFKQNVDRVL